MVLVKLAIGAGMVAATVGVHSLFMVTAISYSRSHAERLASWRTLAMIGVILWFFLAICIECWLWALLFLWLGTIPDLESAVYFATVTFTTLGYGDVVLDGDWRLLSAFAASNGVIVFGWTTAMVYMVAQRLYQLGE
jgi:hypothetical protein